MNAVQSPRFAGTYTNSIKATGATLIPDVVVQDLDNWLKTKGSKIKGDARQFKVELFETGDGPFPKTKVQVRRQPQSGKTAIGTLLNKIKAKWQDYSNPQFQEVFKATRPGATVWVDGIPGQMVPFKKGWFSQYESANKFMNRVLGTVNSQVRKAAKVAARQAKATARYEAQQAKAAARREQDAVKAAQELARKSEKTGQVAVPAH